MESPSRAHDVVVLNTASPSSSIAEWTEVLHEELCIDDADHHSCNLPAKSRVHSQRSHRTSGSHVSSNSTYGSEVFAATTVEEELVGEKEEEEFEDHDAKRVALHVTAAIRKKSRQFETLETEYAKLRFDQAQLVALQDQRKMQYQKAKTLLDSLQAEIVERTEKNARLDRQIKEVRIQRENLGRLKKSSKIVALERDVEKLTYKRDAGKEALRELRKQNDQEKRKGKELLTAIYDLHSTEATEEDVRLTKKHDVTLVNVSDLEVQVRAMKDEIAQLVPLVTKRADRHGHGESQDDQRTKNRLAA